ncbi:hypothetical protein GCM10011507_11790 [Edaphobacter acidisoli]|uniref:Uncharacterized protein n=1 Tax=Edaphobacter acidisoli TaxID=2040573 RepID=A0A916RLL3_9BACT|nr:hypothetical protein GCM10011507_11790 [Edaphobacter acidisoli]
MIHILRSDGTEFVAPREVSPIQLSDKMDMQVSVREPVIAKDGRTVGWLAEFPNCCTSYPIPLVLVLYRDGTILRRIVPKTGLPLWRWAFLEDGNEVEYYADTVHSNLNPTCELRDVMSGELLDEWHRGKSKTLPGWAEPFAKDVGDLEGPSN